jgi:hypothetical protein
MVLFGKAAAPDHFTPEYPDHIAQSNRLNVVNPFGFAITSQTKNLKEFHGLMLIMRIHNYQ